MPKHYIHLGTEIASIFGELDDSGNVKKPHIQAKVAIEQLDETAILQALADLRAARAKLESGEVVEDIPAAP